MINGVPHGPQMATTTCQLTMRHFKEGDELFLEPWRALAFPIIKDLVVDRAAFDRIIQSGGYVAVSTAARRMAMRFPFRSRKPIARWTRPLVSVVAPASPLVPTRRPLCSPERKSNT